MIRRITALVTAVMMALLLSVTVFAADNPGGDHGLLIDERDIFTSDEEDKINDLLLTTARTIHMNVAVLMPELITSTEQETCDNVISTYFDRDSSSIVLMLPPGRLRLRRLDFLHQPRRRCVPLSAGLPLGRGVLRTGQR